MNELTHCSNRCILFTYSSITITIGGVQFPE